MHHCCGTGEGGQAAVQTAAQQVQESLVSSNDADSFEADSTQRRQRLRTLFEAMDRDHNNKLDVGEFRGDFGSELSSLRTDPLTSH